MTQSDPIPRRPAPADRSAGHGSITMSNSAFQWALAAILVSVYGQLYNQLRDYDMDKAAGLHNTAIIVGERATRLLMYLCLGVGGVLFVMALLLGVLPIWLPVLGAAFFGIATLIYRPGKDMRGGKVADTSGHVQINFLIAANATVGVWLVLALLF